MNSSSDSLYKAEVWPKVLHLCFILFFMLLADSILSFWVPNFMTSSLGSAALMGVAMSFSSVVGFATDVLFPQLVKRIEVRKLLFTALVVSVFFSITLIGTTVFPYFLIFLVAMGLWGVYYEFLGFAQQRFVGGSVPFRFHASVWGILVTFRNIAYLIGPIISSALLTRGTSYPIYISLLFAGIGGALLILHKKKHKVSHEEVSSIKNVSLVREVEHWALLFRRIWPVAILNLFLGTIDAFHWSIGAVLTENLAKESFLGGLWLTVYMIPSTFVGFFISRVKIESGKKKTAEICLLLASALLSLIFLSPSIAFDLVIVFVSSLLLSVSSPLTDAVYSDVVSRMGKQRQHLIGLARSSTSLAYIIGPLAAGLISSVVGERFSFAVLGLVGILVSILLLIYTPKKIHLPQEEIKTWE